MHDYVKQRKPAIAAEGKQFRKAIAKEWRHYSMEDWRATVFSDEKTIGQDYTGQRQRVWLEEHAPFNEDRMESTHVCGGPSVKIWAAITPSGVLAYCPIEPAINATQYKKILRDKLLPAAKKHFPKGVEWTFQQDNAKFHITDDILELLEKKGVNVLQWPSNSPDLNIIENFWPKLNAEVHTRPLRNKQDILAAIDAAISKFNEEEPTTHYFEHLYNSIPDRIKAVLESEGQPIDY